MKRGHDYEWSTGKRCWSQWASAVGMETGYGLEDRVGRSSAVP
jgi:hypothetical protein